NKGRPVRYRVRVRTPRYVGIRCARQPRANRQTVPGTRWLWSLPPRRRDQRFRACPTPAKARPPCRVARAISLFPFSGLFEIGVLDNIGPDGDFIAQGLVGFAR